MSHGKSEQKVASLAFCAKVSKRRVTRCISRVSRSWYGITMAVEFAPAAPPRRHRNGCGPATLRGCAVDAAGRTRPTATEWNRLSYANKAIQVVGVTVA